MPKHPLIKTTALAAVALLLTALVAACGESATTGVRSDSEELPAGVDREDLATAVFAAGCFWCVEEAFDPVPGVVKTTSGYIGGQLADPIYEEVSAGGTGHTEALEVLYDPEKVGYDELLTVFWRNVDPTDAGGQFCDRGSQYRGGIFYTNDQQKAQATASKKALQEDPDAPSPIVTEITAAGPFYMAEQYHQNYYQKNPARYTFYKTACGRANRLEALWGPK